MKTEVIVRKWGNSLGVIIPKVVIEEEKIKEKDKLKIDVKKEFDISDLFGTVKLKRSTQKIKDEIRKGWG